MLSVPTTSVAYSEVVEGGTTRSVEIPVPTNIQITAIETAAEPGPTSITLASETYNIYSDVTETELGTVISSRSALGTVSVDMATPTGEIDSGGQSAVASIAVRHQPLQRPQQGMQLRRVKVVFWEKLVEICYELEWDHIRRMM
ncbi:hypothetical protein C361_05209 [Cryptococcus neoformans Tu259-1]|uniref:Uncharacterized protein n=1 Tax=Cryptococcus neoformans Tu259-1 TaxID=1230072 RepID=A0A854QET4_CRYNE|nr:hypothetical protein C361_05209 [Cryptococcus neoformans var. grubii Tu259-1]